MLVRADFNRILMRDQDGIVMRHVRRAFRIREKFIDIPLRGTAEVLLPNCHEVARAYARAFDAEFKDGLVAFVSGAEVSQTEGHILTSLQVHSWNIVRVGEDHQVILDVFPDIGLSMMPVVHPYPHPAYIESTDGATLRSLQARSTFDTSVELLADEFRRIGQYY